MDPPSNPFLVPGKPVRPRTEAVASAADATASIVASASQLDPAHDTVIDNTSAETYPSQPSQEVQEGVVIYTKPIITASQIGPTQQTQVVAFDETEMDEDSEVFACMRGHGTTMDADLTMEKDVYTFGTSRSCDFVINHAHWPKAPGNDKPLEQVWFKLHLQRSKSSQGNIKVFIEDTSASGVYLNRKRLKKNERKLLRWADVITGGLGKDVLFHYSYNNNNKTVNTIIEGGVSTYSVEDRACGSGMYSQVFKAQDVSSGAIYACKVIDLLRRELNHIERESIAFEIDLLKQLHHPNIVQFVDVSQVGYKTYILTEFIDGMTLYELYNDQHNYLRETEARDIFTKVCGAVYYLHKRSIVHRDIKSDNVMISNDRSEVKLIDFGLARCTENQPLLSTICGTHAYMAPETAAGEEKNGYGKSVDIWALGVMLFRMQVFALAGKYPFDDNTYEGTPDQPARTETDELEQHAIQAHEDIKIEIGDLNYTAGRPSAFKRDWRPYVDRMSRRTPEAKDLLEQMLKIDPTRRIRISQVFAHDWIRMMDEELEKADCSDSIAVLPQTIAGTKRKVTSDNAWGELIIIPGSMDDAPRSIKLTMKQTWLGRSPGIGLDVSLGFSPYLSTYQCMIERGDDGIVLAADASLNGTYINSMKIHAGKAMQLLNGDEICFITTPDSFVAMDYSRNRYKTYLKYRVAIFGEPEPSEEMMFKRRYVDTTLKLPPRVLAQARSESFEEPWGRLLPLSNRTVEEKLTGSEIRIGRNRDCEIVVNGTFISREHCTLKWEAAECKAYLHNLSPNGTYVNGKPFEGCLQLRHNDKIYLLLPQSNIAEEPLGVGYIILYAS
ncbi:Checkpoint kinase 2 [Haplosporangium sp. Z 767]|nr:Checkpoint kinase 2 [Haplosporangium sp. Z 767]KAF9185068.1 Checkpoint kinase 2 [Haplosporangium sp. Z 11]